MDVRTCEELISETAPTHEIAELSQPVPDPHSWAVETEEGVLVRYRQLRISNPRKSPDDATFPRFSELPIDLRLQIWKEAKPHPQVVTIKTESGKAIINNFDWIATTKLKASYTIPSLFHVNQEAREVASKMYTKLLWGHLNSIPIYFDFQNDILYTKERWTLPHLESLKKSSDPSFEISKNLRHLACGRFQIDPSLHPETRRRICSTHPNLQTLFQIPTDHKYNQEGRNLLTEEGVFDHHWTSSKIKNARLVQERSRKEAKYSQTCPEQHIWVNDVTLKVLKHFWSTATSEQRAILRQDDQYILGLLTPDCCHCPLDCDHCPPRDLWQG